MSAAIRSRIIQKSCTHIASVLETSGKQAIWRQSRYYRVTSTPNKLVDQMFSESNLKSCVSERRLHMFTPKNVVKASPKMSEMLPEEDSGSEYIVQELAHKADMENFTWIRRANREEELYHECNKYGTRYAIACVTLNSAKPLNYNTVKKAFKIVQNGCPNLNLALVPKGDELWLKEFHDSEIDFKVFPEDTDVSDVLDYIGTEGFDSKDKPHWRVIMIPRSRSSTCVLPGVKDEFPYQYDYIIHPNHAFIDGTNIAYVIHLAHAIIEKLIAGISVPEHTKFGDMSGLGDLKALETIVEKSLLENTDHFDKLINEMPPADNSLLITESFDKPLNSEPSTRHVTRVIDSDVMANLHKKCKNHEVTFNSALVAVINTALVEIMKEAGINRDSYKIYNKQLVNLRRYLKNQKTMALGSFQFPFAHSSVVNNSVIDNFWEYTKTLNADLQSRLNSHEILEQKMMLKLTSTNVSPAERLANPSPIIHDFAVSNFGELSTFVPGKGKHVLITDLRAYNTIHRLLHTHMHQVVSYKGHCSYSLSYDTSYMTENTANTVADKVMLLLSELSQ